MKAPFILAGNVIDFFHTWAIEGSDNYPEVKQNALKVIDAVQRAVFSSTVFYLLYKGQEKMPLVVFTEAMYLMAYYVPETNFGIGAHLMTLGFLQIRTFLMMRFKQGEGPKPMALYGLLHVLFGLSWLKRYDQTVTNKPCKGLGWVRIGIGYVKMGVDMAKNGIDAKLSHMIGAYYPTIKERCFQVIGLVNTSVFTIGIFSRMKNMHPHMPLIYFTELTALLANKAPALRVGIGGYLIYQSYLQVRVSLATRSFATSKLWLGLSALYWLSWVTKTERNADNTERQVPVLLWVGHRAADLCAHGMAYFVTGRTS
jgi:hypothetical protein